MSEEQIPVSEVQKPSSKPWNRDGYLPTISFGTQILKSRLGSIRMSHPYEGHLFRTDHKKDASGMSRICNYRYWSITERLAVEVDELRWSEPNPASVTDVFLSPELSRLYVLDTEGSVVHLFRIPSLASGFRVLERERAIQLKLPPRVILTQDSRITVVSRVDEAPEKRDPLFYVSAPGSHVILRVDAETGVAEVALGTLGRPGATRAGEIESAIFLRYPSALFFDERGGLLYWSDSGNRAVFSIRDRSITQVTSFPGQVKLSSLLVYRLTDHVDVPMMLQKDDRAIAPDWEENEPALLLATDSLSCQVFKVRLHGRDRSPIALFDFAPRSPADPTALERLMELPNGDLLVSTNSDWVYHVRHTPGAHSSTSRDEYIS